MDRVYGLNSDIRAGLGERVVVCKLENLDLNLPATHAQF